MQGEPPHTTMLDRLTMPLGIQVASKTSSAPSAS
jgi:hypothetical protein